MKLAKLSKRHWFTNFLNRDLSPTSSGASKGAFDNGCTKTGDAEFVPSMYKAIGFVFAVIGALGTLRWFVYLTISLDTPIRPQQTSSVSKVEPEIVHEQVTDETSGECSINHAILEFTNRLQVLELAFKEQVYARETIAREINDQSDIYGTLDRKLTLFLEKLDNISTEFAELELKYKNISNRLYSDELLGMLVVLVIILELFYWCRPRVQGLVNKMNIYRPQLAKFLAKNKLERKDSSNPGTPKRMSGLRNEICVIFFQRESANTVFLNLCEGMLRHLEGVKVAAKPYYAVFSHEDLRSMPHVRLYVIIVDMETRGSYINGSEKDLVMMTVKYTNSIGGQTVVVIANDEGSKNLTAHSMFNSSIRMVRANDCMQDLASNGRLFSIWQEMTSHQLSHLRRVIKTVLNLKLTLR